MDPTSPKNIGHCSIAFAVLFIYLFIYLKSDFGCLAAFSKVAAQSEWYLSSVFRPEKMNNRTLFLTGCFQR